jgi:hypothetical protein
MTVTPQFIFDSKPLFVPREQSIEAWNLRIDYRPVDILNVQRVNNQPSSMPTKARYAKSRPAGQILRRPVRTQSTGSAGDARRNIR